MNVKDDFSRGVVVGLFGLVGGQALHWFLTPLNHPDATMLRAIGVGIQAVVGFGGAFVVARRRATRSEG